MGESIPISRSEQAEIRLRANVRFYMDFGFAVPVDAEDFPIDCRLVSHYSRAHSWALTSWRIYATSSFIAGEEAYTFRDRGARVAVYSLAAAAASVSVLALAQPAEAEIIITNKTIPIHANKRYSSTSMGMGK